MSAGNGNSSCSVCLEDFTDDLVVLPACGHVFHGSCIGQWYVRMLACRRRVGVHGATRVAQNYAGLLETRNVPTARSRMRRKTGPSRCSSRSLAWHRRHPRAALLTRRRHPKLKASASGRPSKRFVSASALYNASWCYAPCASRRRSVASSLQASARRALRSTSNVMSKPLWMHLAWRESCKSASRNTPWSSSRHSCVRRACRCLRRCAPTAVDVNSAMHGRCAS